ncbi:MAG: choice-of-anchor L domain-containing protein [Bacteroidota bacterium]|jgi:gliding motility-associated-like protein
MLCRGSILNLGIFFILCSQLSAQLSVFPNGNATVLANTIVGSGIQITNAQIQCGSGNSGTFLSTSTNLGIGSGIILSTGSVFNAIGPNDEPGQSANGTNCPYSTDPQLTSIVNNANYDGCVLEFDIVPACSTLNINYVFASEEYPEYVGSQYNDVFGFFISGPNPSGGNYNNYNIARLPNNTPVAINNVNNGTSNSGPCNNCSYYVNNGDGSSSGGATIQFDGLTTPLTAIANVVPCTSYHLKLAIADAGDCDWDSGVFLAYQGLTCPASQVPAVSVNTSPVICGNDGAASVNVTNYSGTPTYQWSPGGNTTSSISNLSPGTYTCVVGFLTPCPYTETVTAVITGTQVINSQMSSTPSTCGSTNGTATANVSGGTGPYTFTWNTTPTQTTATASGLTPGTYTVTIQDNSNCVVTQTITVGLFQPSLTVTDSIISSTCGQSNGAIFLNNLVGGTPPYIYNWNSGPISQDFFPVGPGTYSITITDALNCIWNFSYLVPNLASLPYLSSQTNDTCAQSVGTASVLIQNGIPPYSYSWNTVPAQTGTVASGLSEGIYNVNITDASGCGTIVTFNIGNVVDNFGGNVVVDPVYPQAGAPFTVTLNGQGNWNIDQSNWPDGSVSNTTSNNLIIQDFGIYPGSFYLISENNCFDTLEYSVFVKDKMTLYVPNAFTPNNDGKNEMFKAYGTLVKVFHMLVFDRWGNLIFESSSLGRGWDGTLNGEKVMQGVYVWKVYATDFYDEEHVMIGHVTLIR